MTIQLPATIIAEAGLPSAPDDRLIQVNLSEETQIRSGIEALKRLASGQAWTDWLVVGAALLVGRSAAMHEANSNQPVGRRYNEIFGDWLARHGFDRIDKSVRSRLMECMDHRAEIEAWRSTLPLNKRMQLNYPATVLKHWKSATEVPKQDMKVSPMAKVRASLAETIEENHRLKQEIDRGGGDLWTATDRADDIAAIMMAKLSRNKAEQVARAILKRLKEAAEAMS
jgi:hypothetical protein